MTDAIVQWLLSAGEGKFLATVLISMLPVIELRGGLPAGVAMGLPLREAFFAALLGNLLPVPFIILFARRGFAWVRAHIPRLGRWVDRIERKAWSKSDKVVRYQAWGLLLFVAVPLPGTGAWTGVRHRLDDIGGEPTDNIVVGGILSESGVSEEKVESFRRECEKQYGENAALNPKNILGTGKFEITTPEVKITVAPENSYLIEARMIGGRRYLLIPADDGVEVNGVSVNIPNEEHN